MVLVDTLTIFELGSSAITSRIGDDSGVEESKLYSVAKKL